MRASKHVLLAAFCAATFCACSALLDTDSLRTQDPPEGGVTDGGSADLGGSDLSGDSLAPDTVAQVPVLNLTPTTSENMDVSGGNTEGAGVTFVVENNGNGASAALSAPMLGGANFGNFEVVSGQDACTGTVLTVGGRCTFRVRPIASANGQYSATLSISDGNVTSNSANLSGEATGFAPGLSITPASVTTMDINNGQSPGAAVQFTVENDGTTSTGTLLAPMISGSGSANFEVAGQNSCTGQSLPGLTTCNFSVRPIASANGPYMATLSISDGSINSNMVSIGGRASGFDPVLVIAPDPSANMDITGGSSPGAAVTFTLQNTGSAASATLTAPSLAGANPGNFELVPGQDNCTGTTVAPANQCTFQLRPVATDNGAYAATVTVGDGAVSSNAAALSGTASGFTAPAPVLVIAPDPSANMDITGGSSPGAAVTFTLQNTGSAASATLTAPSLAGANPGNFELVPGQDNCTGTTVAPANQCTFQLRPVATDNGAYAATVTVGDGAVSSNAAALSGTASGFTAPAPVLVIAPDPSANMDITGGSSPGAAVTFTLQNTGSAASATLTAPSLAGANPGNFELVPGQDNCTGTTVAPANQCTFQLRPVATDNGAYAATVTVGDGAVSSNAAALSGTASGFTAPAPVLVIAPDPSANMDITGGSSPGAAVTFTLQNTGSAASATLTAPSLAGANPGNFELVPGQDNCTGTTVAPANQCTFQLRPVATADGAYAATVTVGDGAVFSNAAALSGTASGF